MIRICSVLIESLVDHPEERLLLGGTANLTRNVADFPGSLREVLEALEEQVVVLKLLAAASDTSTVTVRIGEENEAQEMRSTSVVSVGYGGPTPLGRDGRRRPDQDGLPGHHRRRPRGGELRGGHPRRPLRPVWRPPQTRRQGTTRPWAPQWAATAGGLEHSGEGLLRHARGRARTRHPRRSSAPTASSLGSCTRTSTRTPRRSTGSATSRPPTRCCPTRRSGRSSTSAATRWPAAAAAGVTRSPASASATSWTRSSARPAARAAPAAGAARAAGCRPGPDALIRLSLTLEECFTGVSRELTVDTAILCELCAGEGTRKGTKTRVCDTCGGRGEIQSVQRSFLGQVVTARPCPVCRGFGEVIPDPCPRCAGEGRVRARRTITVKVPAGVADGIRVRHAGQGEVGPGGGPAGDLYVEVEELPHETFEREGADLHCTVRLPMTAAALGAVLPLETLDGTEELAIDAGHPAQHRAGAARPRPAQAAVLRPRRRPRRPARPPRRRDPRQAGRTADRAAARVRRTARRGAARTGHQRPRRTRPVLPVPRSAGR